MTACALGPLSSARRDPRGEMERSLVLIVDDQEKVRHLFAHMLRQSGLDTTEASNGEEALSLLEDGLNPAVIVLDLWMPIMDGWEFMERARTSVPIVVVSGIEEDPHALPPGVVALLKKPVGAHELAAAIRVARDGKASA